MPDDGRRALRVGRAAWWRRGVNYKNFYNVNFPARRRENRGADGYFNASKWPPQESGLIGPVTLMPLESVTFE